ncbi:hypothetical protein KVH24_14990 [Streptomyces olivaceus]|uniref:hypothetical protein n=1 Tax=Streptomyces olivaceus TaxID=47716 RepID=UPI001CCDD986|nr:hypothetical protein [Streptomyces olivaceus]MBZ6174127.1 hypothetical protein [Streptomyces olivaceus]MBZ6180305.1 hypothetical protein [Streptomyces olivaceus]
MIRIVTRARLARLEDAARTASEQARQASGAANEAFGRHLRELYAVTDRAERAEATTNEVSVLLSGALAELSEAQQELLRKDIEIRRLREELNRGPREGETVTVLLHHGEPHAVYASREAAHADTATHGYPADHVWTPCDERPAAVFTWRCEAFIYNPASRGFHRVYTAVPRALDGAA